MKKKIIFIISLFALVLILFINNRTPFFTSQKGGWSIGFNIYDSIPSFLKVKEGNIFSIEKMKKIDDSTDFLADPFFITEKDTVYIFFEYQMKNGRANIALMKSVDAVNFKYDRVVLDEKFHLSYPNVFKYRNSFYMVPETKRANNILLYKAYNFPYDWRVYDTLIKNVKLKDPSIYLSDSLNFLVASDDNLNLFMYESDSLFGKWRKHKNRHLVKFGSEARPAGRIFLNEDRKIIIPLQNSFQGYGYGVSLYELNFDKKNNYDIELLSKFFLKANKNIKEFSGGMHHVDIQKYKGKYFIVYDGNHLKNVEGRKFNWKFPIKASYLDTKNYFYQLFN